MAARALAWCFAVTATLRYERATVGYDAPVVSCVTLEVEPGEVVGLIGPNGAGKTTLVRSVTGGARVFEGTVSVAGTPVASLSRTDLARVVAVLPQTAPTTFAFTARQFVEMGRHAHVSRFGDMKATDHAAVDRAMTLTDTVGLATRRVDELSGGDLQRLTLAQALAQEPSILLLDEPTSHLDLNHRLQVLDVVRSLADEGLAVLAVFHDLDMAARYSDRLVVVAGGEAAQQGSPSQVLTQDTLRRVFGVAAVIGTDPVTGSVQVLPVVRSGAAPVPRRGARVLVVSGSGTGAALMRRVVLEGYDVSAGALSLQDTDGAVASALGLEMRPVAPFARLTPADETEVTALARAADVAVVVATPFGPENVGNLRAVVRSGALVVLVGEMGPELDFCRGEATALWSRLVEAGARECGDVHDVVRCIEEVRR
jgi:iron complex transport system ATP-binding protein